MRLPRGFFTPPDDQSALYPRLFKGTARGFVQERLKEIAPDFVIPGQEKTMAELLQGLESPETLRRVRI